MDGWCLPARTDHPFRVSEPPTFTVSPDCLAFSPRGSPKLSDGPARLPRIRIGRPRGIPGHGGSSAMWLSCLSYIRLRHIVDDPSHTLRIRGHRVPDWWSSTVVERRRTHPQLSRTVQHILGRDVAATRRSIDVFLVVELMHL